MLVGTIGEYTIRKLPYTPHGFNDRKTFSWIVIECYPKSFITYITSNGPFRETYYNKETATYIGNYIDAKIPIEVHEAVIKMINQIIEISNGQPLSYIENDD